jgi:hypothetical protein
MAPKLELREKNELRILAFGDSLTAGYANWGTKFHPYAGRSASPYNHTALNHTRYYIQST